MNPINYLNNHILKTYPSARLYVVGGSVRDKLLKKPISDVDIVITHLSRKDLEMLLKRYGTVKLVGKSFGVYKWMPFYPISSAIPNIDIALPRKEVGWGTGGRRDFTIQTDCALSIEEDLSRRDFTINAIAYDPNARRYIDPFSGRKDLRKKIIKTVGNPTDRFTEDASRILRALRFACQMRFTIHPSTWSAIQNHQLDIKKVAKEIAAKEFVKAISLAPSYAIHLFEKAGVLSLLIPEILEMQRCRQPKRWHSEGTVWKHVKLALQKLEQIKTISPPYDPNIVLALLFHDGGKPRARAKKGRRITFYGHDKIGAQIAGRVIKRLKLESAGVNKEHVQWLIRNHMILFSGDPQKMKNTTVETYFLSDRHPSHHLLTLIECDARATIPADPSKQKSLGGFKIIKKRIAEILRKPKRSLLNGDEIMKILGIPQGVTVGKILIQLREAELSGKVNSKIQARRFIKQ